MSSYIDSESVVFEDAPLHRRPVETIGDRVKLLLAMRGWGVNDLDRAIGQGGYSTRLVRNEKKKPDPAIVAKIAEALVADRSWLLFGDGARPDPKVKVPPPPKPSEIEPSPEPPAVGAGRVVEIDERYPNFTRKLRLMREEGVISPGVYSDAMSMAAHHEGDFTDEETHQVVREVKAMRKAEAAKSALAVGGEEPLDPELAATLPKKTKKKPAAK